MKRKTLLREKKKADARWQILNKVFADFYSISGKNVEYAKNILKPHADIIAAQWRYLVKTDPWKPDLRCGYETYGYKDDESIMYNLQYISDRWNCTFRLRWTLDLINQ